MNLLMLVLLVVLVFIILCYWLVFYTGINRITQSSLGHGVSLPPVSVIVAYKNAEKNLLKTINFILSQDYPLFELIVIDDFSTDESAKLLSTISDQRLVKLKATKDLSGKKAALTEAISAAKFDILLFTDADCIPASDQWIKSMTDRLCSNEKTEIVLGYGPMNKKNGWINTFARYETILTAMQYSSYAALGTPYMGVGRNLMYRKRLFARVNGFTDHQHIPSGDDDLMISKTANRENTVVNLDPQSFVYSDAKEGIYSFLYQKTRHISTSFHYTLYHKIFLGLFAISQLSFFILLLISLTLGYLSAPLALFFVGTKWAIQMILHKDSFEKLAGDDLKRYFPMMDIGMMIYYIMIPIIGVFRKPGW